MRINGKACNCCFYVIPVCLVLGVDVNLMMAPLTHDDGDAAARDDGSEHQRPTLWRRRWRACMHIEGWLSPALRNGGWHCRLRSFVVRLKHFPPLQIPRLR